MKRAWAVLIGAACWGCPNHERKASVKVSEPSPNASILPAPLASGSDLEPHLRHAEGGLDSKVAMTPRLTDADIVEDPPSPLREDEALGPDALGVRDSSGVSLEAQWKWLDLPAPPSAPDVDLEGIKDARQATALLATVDLAASGRARLILNSNVFPLPSGTELRARHDRYGSVLVWPDGHAYRIVPKGALRALFTERRVDVSPLVEPALRHSENGALLGLLTTKLELVTQFGQLMLEQGSITGTGSSGELLCRILIELIGGTPTSSVCGDQLTPLRAEFRWADHGRMAFEVTAIDKRNDLPIGQLSVPPLGAMFKPGELPPEAPGPLLSRQSLMRFRSRDTPRLPAVEDKAPTDGVLAINRTDTLQYLMADGVPIAWLRPHSEQSVLGLRRGRYMLSWRDFLGTETEVRKLVDVPARVIIGRDEDNR